MRPMLIAFVLTIIAGTLPATAQEAVPDPAPWLIYAVLDYGTQHLDTQAWRIIDASSDALGSEVVWQSNDTGGAISITHLVYEDAATRDATYEQARSQSFADSAGQAGFSLSRCTFGDGLARLDVTLPPTDTLDLTIVQIAYIEKLGDTALRSIQGRFPLAARPTLDAIIAQFFPDAAACPA